MGIGLLIALVAGLMARDLVRERRSLARAVEELRRVDGMRAALVSTLAHDVRSPLTAIRGNLDLLLNRGEQIPRDKAEELMSAADRQARRIERLATGLLDLARLDQGHLALDRRPTDLREAVTQALSFVGSAPVEVRIPDGIVVSLDPARFEQIVVNLVTNAQKHGDPPITIEAHESSDRVVIDFADEGRGISGDRLESLFQPFSTETAGSTGLGLSIVRAMVHAHGGEIDYVRNAPQGARFRVMRPKEVSDRARSCC
jgi:K+-sensing histidine kinase KdpD